ncbi:pyrroline-5-carboxylate reductase [Pseudonocardia sp. TMWB2A]|uniref:pyrroline-5-carboxylate reductase family protein n=1 Tax=Pseudonocardia sp. TMWB2A TaxID=687430 RepID=UPI00307E8DD8
MTTSFAPDIPASLRDFAGSLTLVGCGNMAGAMMARWLDLGLAPERVTVVRPSGAAVAEGVRVVTDIAELAPVSGLVLLGFKPQQLADSGPAVARALAPDATVISILAGVALADLEAMFAGHHCIRAMPNMPVREGEGVVLLAGERDAAVDTLMAGLGYNQWLADEAAFDLYSALSGCGPAYLYRVIEAMTGAATRLGLPQDEALAITKAMVRGASGSALRSPLTPGELVAQVASKGGMTQAGLDVLDSDGQLAAIFTDTLRAARDRGKELADAARG